MSKSPSGIYWSSRAYRVEDTEDRTISTRPRKKKRYKNSFILKYKLDYCASGVHDGGREGERSRPNVRGGVDNELRQKMLAKRGKKETTK